MSERVLIVGAGQVGRGLSRALQAAGVTVLDLHGRKPSQFATTCGALPKSLRDANVVIVAVRDPQIEGALDEIDRASSQVSAGTVVLHTSGIHEASAYTNLRGRGIFCGTFHPLAPFSIPDKAVELLRGGWIGLDGDETAKSTGRRLAGHLGARTIDIPPGGKATYHAAAVMASNLPVALAAAAGDLLHSLGIPERSAQGAVESLMRSAVGNLADRSPADALTGPVVRGDPATVKAHLSALANTPAASKIYRSLTRVALDIAKTRGVDAQSLAEIQRALSADDKKRR